VDSDYEDSPAVLFVSPDQNRHIPLAESVELLGLEVLSAARWRDARALLRQRSGIAVVVVNVTLPDGNWCEILRWMIEDRVDASLILVSSVSDAALWSEAVWRGAFDVLVEPFASWEFSRSIEGALRNRSHHGGASYGSLDASDRSGRRTSSGENQARTSRLGSPAILTAVAPA
jgi:DNA-binding NtrC family response regulator